MTGPPLSRRDPHARLTALPGLARLTRWRARTGVRDRGSSAVEVVILAPALGLFLMLIIAGGRVAIAHQALEASAAQAARAASLARTQGQALTDARTAADSSLSAQGLDCVRTTVEIDTTGFAAPVGTPASVGATVTCQVDLAGLIPALPGSIPVTATIRSPLDTYRER
ncbi:TadE family protein [Dermatophilaceae bacterium Soc4.6]